MALKDHISEFFMMVIIIFYNMCWATRTVIFIDVTSNRVVVGSSYCKILRELISYDSLRTTLIP